MMALSWNMSKSPRVDIRTSHQCRGAVITRGIGRSRSVGAVRPIKISKASAITKAGTHWTRQNPKIGIYILMMRTTNITPARMVPRSRAITGMISRAILSSKKPAAKSVRRNFTRSL
jgi:hypothetical protein